MPLTAADIKFFAATNNTDNADGGGARSSTLVQNGVLHTLFPAVAAADRTSGRTSVRKLYPSLTNADATPLLGSTLAFNEVPTDAAVSVVAWATGDASTTRAQAIAGLYTLHAGSTPRTWKQPPAFGANETAILTVNRPFTNTEPPAVGQRLVVFDAGQAGNWPTGHRCTVTYVSGLQNPGGVGTATFWQVGIDPPLPGWVWSTAVPTTTDVTTTPAYGCTTTTASAASGASAVVVASTSAQLVPYSGSGAYPTTDLGVPPAQLQYASGRVPILRVGDAVCLSDEQAMSAATVSGGQNISTGRTGLDQVAVVGNDGVEIARIFDGGPPSTALSCNFATGVVTIGTVTGWSQPVTVRHRIAHRAAVSGISGTTVSLSVALPATYPSGSVLASELPRGDVQARVSAIFAQQAWTRQWSSTLIGNPIGALYTGTPVVTNQGAESDRYAVVFSTATSFVAYSERLGQLGNGTTATNFAPLNPATGAPLFTLLAANWLPDIGVGSTMRFDTVGAAPPVWVARCVRPSTPTGTTRAVLRLRGSV